jgi:hypothetical protein
MSALAGFGTLNSLQRPNWMLQAFALRRSVSSAPRGTYGRFGAVHGMAASVSYVRFVREGAEFRISGLWVYTSQEARENEDIHRREMVVRLKAEQERALQVVNAVFTNVGAGARELIADPTKISLLVGSLTALAVGVYGAREGTKLTARVLEKYLGQPSLVRETSKRTLNPKTWGRSAGGAPATTGGSGLAPVAGLGDVVLPGPLEARVRQLATATTNQKKHGAPFRNAMFYGPPGTGKTLAAKQLAKHSGMDFAIMTGGDVAPLGADAVTRLHELFDWAEASNKGLLLFIDEADAFLGVRGQTQMSEGVRAALNALLSRTGKSPSPPPFPRPQPYSFISTFGTTYIDIPGRRLVFQSLAIIASSHPSMSMLRVQWSRHMTLGSTIGHAGAVWGREGDDETCDRYC